MKNKLFRYTLILVATFTLTYCGDEDTETCEQDEICENQITTCCDESTCVWQYDGNEYSEEELGDLADDLGCGTAFADMIPRLQALAVKARAGL